MNSSTNKLNILIVSTNFPPTAGGVAIAGLELAHAFTTMGHHVSVICAKQTLKPDFNFGPNFLVYPIGVHDEECLSPPLTKEIHLCWKSINADIVIINGMGKCVGKLVFELASQNNIPIIVRSHGSSTCLNFSLRKPPFFGFGQWLTSFLKTTQWIRHCASFHQIVFLSSRTGILSNFDRLMASKMHLKNISDIPNTFESIRLDKNTFCERYGLKGMLFAYIAGFSPRKNQMEAVRAIKDSDLENVTFVFIGPQRNDYAAQTEKLAGDDPRFVFLYDIPRQDVLEAQNACDCDLLYATHEQQPLVLLEAMSCKKPWICTNVGSVSEMKGGIILRKRSPKCLVDAIKSMQDPGTRKQYGEAGYQQWQEQFSPDSVYARWDKMLSDIIAHKPVRGGY